MSTVQRLGYAYGETKRILRLTRKPKTSEFNETAKITGLGIILIGVIGFAILLVSLYIRGI